MSEGYYFSYNGKPILFTKKQLNIFIDSLLNTDWWGNFPYNSTNHCLINKVLLPEFPIEKRRYLLSELCIEQVHNKYKKVSDKDNHKQTLYRYSLRNGTTYDVYSDSDNAYNDYRSLLLSVMRNPTNYDYKTGKEYVKNYVYQLKNQLF